MFSRSSKTDEHHGKVTGGKWYFQSFATHEKSQRAPTQVSERVKKESNLFQKKFVRGGRWSRVSAMVAHRLLKVNYFPHQMAIRLTENGSLVKS